MKSRILSTDQPLNAPSHSPLVDDGLTAFSIAEFMMLEECIRRCEALADTMTGRAAKASAFLQLSECIAAGRSYLAARSRDSKYSSRHGDLCREVLTATAAACRELDSDAALRCRMSCEIALEFVEEGARNRAGLCN